MSKKTRREPRAFPGCRNYEEFRSEIGRLPATWYPDLLRALTEASYLNGVFRPGGASKVVREAERKFAAKNSAERNSDGTLRNFMPRVGGKPFRCECGCNVFHKPISKSKLLFECNSCGARFTGT